MICDVHAHEIKNAAAKKINVRYLPIPIMVNLKATRIIKLYHIKMITNAWFPKNCLIMASSESLFRLQ